ncbi:MAG: FecR domain-containing protein [Leptospiraceae bacterium]|nr:FecR domain-containing protein [Leptospiraceae bacterium]
MRFFTLFLFLFSLSLFSEPNLIEYKVKPGDTLSKISNEFLSDPGKWKELLQYNKIDNPAKIAPGLVLKIPSHLAKASLLEAAPSASAIARADLKIGDVRFKSEKDDKFKPFQAKQEFQKNDIIETGSNSSVQIRFLKEPYVTVKVKSNSQLKISEDGNLKTVELKVGDMFADVTGKKGSKEEKFKVVTPTSTAGIRGTQFDVGVDSSGSDSYSCLEGQMQIMAQGVVKELPAGFGISVKKGEPPSEPVKLLPKGKFLPMEIEN